MTTHEDKLVCDSCGSETDVKTVQMRKEGMAHDFDPQRTRLCQSCRKKKHGRWRYWR